MPDAMTTTPPQEDGVPDVQKQTALIALYQILWAEMTWRRNAGYRTIILGLAYCTALLTAVSFHPEMPDAMRYCLCGVLVIATVFGSGYLCSNYYKYMSAAQKAVAIEECLGAFRDDFLGRLGPLMPADRRDWARTPLTPATVSFWSILALLAGGLLTAAAVLFL